jgi:release factor glutamine methyltransferase
MASMTPFSPASGVESLERLFQELREELAAKCLFLKDKPRENPDNTLRALWFAAAGQPCAVGRLNGGPLPALDEERLSRLKELVRQRLAGVPLAYLTGREEFMGLEFISGPAAFIPRLETELVATAALGFAREALKPGRTATVIDICCGSGNISLAFAYHEPRLRIVATDASEDALALARRNARHLGLEGRVEFHKGDLFAPFESVLEGQVDVIVGNPPYICSQRLRTTVANEIAVHEPRASLDGGPFGISVVGRVIADAPKFLRPGGWLCIEIGLGQTKNIVSLVTRNGKYGEVRVEQDGTGEERAVLARVA